MNDCRTRGVAEAVTNTSGVSSIMFRGTIGVAVASLTTGLPGLWFADRAAVI